MAGSRNLGGRALMVWGAAIALLVFLFHMPFAGNTLFFDDAADYVRAADDGWMAVWWNTDSASPLQLMTLRRQAEFRAHPWDTLYARNDNAALRHFHVPLSFYPLHLCRLLTRSEAPVRLMTSSVTALTCGLLVIVLAILSVPLPLAVSAALLAGLQSRYIETSTDPSPHSWYMLFAFSFLFLFTLYLLTRRPASLYLASIALALAVATLEFSVELVASVPLALALVALTGPGRLPPWRLCAPVLLRGAGIGLLVTFVVWPGGWLRGGYLESYGVLSATVLFKNKSAFGERLAAGVIYQALLAHHLIFLLLILFCAFGLAVLFLLRSASIAAVVFASYSLIAFGLGVADHFRLGTYVSEFLLFLIATSALVLSDLLDLPAIRSRGRQAGALAAALLLLTGCASEWRQRNAATATRPWLRPIFAGLCIHVPPGEVLLVDNDREALALYLPRYRYEPAERGGSAAPRLPTRNGATRYALLDAAVMPPAGSRHLAQWPAAPGHARVLWQLTR